MRLLIGLAICLASCQGWATTIDLEGSASPVPRTGLLDPAVRLPRRGVIVAKLAHGRLLARAADAITGLFGPPLVFSVHALDRLVLDGLTQQTRYTLLSNQRRGKGNGHHPLVMELELNGHKRWITVRHHPRDHIALENQGKIPRSSQAIDL